MSREGTFQAVYRYRSVGDLRTTVVEFWAKSLEIAKQQAKQLEGQDGKTWLKFVKRKRNR